MFDMSGLEFDTTSLKHWIPILEEKVGPNEPLEMEIRLENIQVMFGQYDSNVLLDYRLHYNFLSQRNKKLLISDTVHMITAMNIKT